MNKDYDLLRNAGKYVITNQTLQEDINGMLDILLNYLSGANDISITRNMLSVYKDKYTEVENCLKFYQSQIECFNDLIEFIETDTFVQYVIENKNPGMSTQDVYHKYLPAIQALFDSKGEFGKSSNMSSIWLNMFNTLNKIVSEEWDNEN